MIFNSPQLSDGTSVCNIYCTLFHLRFRDSNMHSTSLRLLLSINYCARIVIDVDSHIIWILLIQYVDAILSVFLALYVGEIPIFDL